MRDGPATREIRLTTSVAARGEKDQEGANRGIVDRDLVRGQFRERRGASTSQNMKNSLRD